MTSVPKQPNQPEPPAALSMSTLPAPSVNVPLGFAEKHPNHAEKISRHQLIYSITGLVLGLVCILGGLLLFLNGVAGNMSWSAKILGAQSTISDAAPGAVLFIVGMFIVLITRYVFRIKN